MYHLLPKAPLSAVECGADCFILCVSRGIGSTSDHSNLLHLHNAAIHCLNPVLALLPLMAQLVAPPLQNSPVRLPGPDAGERRPASQPTPPPLDVEVAPPPAEPVEPPAAEPGVTRQGLPQVRGLTVYSPEILISILERCRTIADPAERLNACAAALKARLEADGYLNTRVYTSSTPAPGVLDVVEGRIVELRVEGPDTWLNRRVSRLLSPLRGSVLRVSTVERDLQLLRRRPELAEVRGNLTRLGSDPSQAVLRVRVSPGVPDWNGELSARNDGSNGSGEFRGVASLARQSVLRRGDTLLLYGEANASDNADFGALISSLSYSFPFTDTVSLTGAFGYSRRNLVELPSPSDGFSTSQYQGLGQLEWVFRETLRDRWSVFAAYSGNRSNTYLNDRALPDILPEVTRAPSSGYLRFGLSASSIANRAGWSGNVYLLQGVSAATPENQRRELAQVGIDPGQSTAMGGILSVGWAFAPRWQLNVRGAGQVAFRQLTSPMQFSIGSDVGLRGLPGQLVSGDNGWLGTAEVVHSFWQKGANVLQVVPFFGAGGISTSFPDLTITDTVGSGGVLVRWLSGNHWSLELGWVEQFEVNNNLGVWQDWLLGSGLYGKVQYRF